MILLRDALRWSRCRPLPERCNRGPAQSQEDIEMTIKTNVKAGAIGYNHNQSGSFLKLSIRAVLPALVLAFNIGIAHASTVNITFGGPDANGNPVELGFTGSATEVGYTY